MEKYNDEIELKDVLIKLSEYKLYILKKKFVIISFSLFFFLLGVIFAFLSDTKYNAELTFVVEGEATATNLGGMAGIASQFGIDIQSNQSSTFSQSNILELIKSRGVIESALMRRANINSKSDIFIEHYLKINKIRDSWTGDERLEKISFDDDLLFIHDSISGVVWNNIINDQLLVELQSDKANIIKLTYVSLDDEFAKEFALALIDEMSKMYISHQTAQVNNTLEFLQNRSDSVFEALQIAEEDFAKVKDINQRIVKASGRLKELQLMREVEVLSTMYLEIIKNLELSKMTLLNQTPIINIIDAPKLPLKEESLSKTIFGLLFGLLAGFLSVSYFVVKKLFRDALSES